MRQITFQDFFTLSCIIILSYLFKYIYDVIYHAYFGTLSKVPGPKLYFLTRHFMSIRLLLGRRWKWIQNEIIPTYGPIVRLGPKVIMIADKDAIREIIAADFPKSHSYEKIRADVKFDTLFSAVNKTVHKQRRKMFSPAFANKFLKSMEPLMGSCVKELVYKVNESVEPSSDGVVLNVVNLVQSCIVDILGETNFGGGFNSVKTLTHPLPRKVYDEVSKRAIRSMFPLFKSFLELDPFLWNFSTELIEKRRQSGKTGVDLLQVTLDAVKSVNDDQVTNYEIFEQILEFLIAGTDTVSFTSSMAIILLAKNPSKLKALQQELDNAFGDNGELPEHDQLKSLPYLNAVINETMRLWPVVLDAGIGRFSVKDTVIKGYMIPARTNLLLNFYWLHHDPKYWGENAEEFVPERWLDIDNLPKNVFYPFSSGPRNCIGKNFAMMEMRLIIASLLSQFDVKNISTQGCDVVCYIVPSFKDMKYNLVFNKRKIGISRD